MSMYGMVMADSGTPDRAAILLAMLGNPNPGRLRDAWVERDDKGEPVIAIYTRNGGGNRDCYCNDDLGYAPGECTGCVGDRFAEHPLCCASPDDDFDCTYRTYYFTAPDQYRDALDKVAGDHVDTSARWLDAAVPLLLEAVAAEVQALAIRPPISAYGDGWNAGVSGAAAVVRQYGKDTEK